MHKVSRDLVITGGHVWDDRARAFRAGLDVRISGGSIKEIGPGGTGILPGEVDQFDARGMYVLPGFIDCHVHVMAVHHDVWQLSMQPPTYITAQATHVLEGMLS